MPIEPSTLSVIIDFLTGPSPQMPNWLFIFSGFLQGSIWFIIGFYKGKKMANESFSEFLKEYTSNINRL